MDNLVIKNADLSDASAICGFIHELAGFEGYGDQCSLTEDELKTFMQKQEPLRAVIAVLDGKPIGFASYFYILLASLSGKKVMYIEDAFVTEKYRGQGAGKALFDRLESIAKENGCLRLELKCLAWNENAIGFYDRIGAAAAKDWITYMKRIK